MLKRVLALGAALCAGAPMAAFAEDRPADEKGVLSLVVENDSLSSGADRNYTSGIELAYVSPSKGVPNWLNGAGHFTHWLSDADPSFWGFAIGQSIFTPNDIEANPAPPDQHPYAGWLYAQLMVAAETKTSDQSGHLDSYELEIGMVGPSAMGEEAQDSIHQLLGAPHPQGWDSQLHDELAFAASFDRRWRLPWLNASTGALGGLEMDLTPSAGVTFGTLRDEAHVGVTARIGHGIVYDYGPLRVRPSLSGVEHFNRPDGGYSWSFFIGVQGRAVARDLFLDGNTFRDSASVDRIPYVADLQAGFDIILGDARLAYTYVTRTDEFKTQEDQQDFGALSLSWRY